VHTIFILLCDTGHAKGFYRIVSQRYRMAHRINIHLLLDGKGGNYPDELFDPIWLARGTEIEMEHTSHREVAKIIAKQHFVRDGADYYYYLINMEKEMRS
jgi:hypothetical protein